MRATVEWLVKGRIGIVRAGPRCGRYSKPFEYAAVFVRPKYGPNKAVVKALVADGHFKTAHKKVMMAALLRTFSGVTWDRFKCSGYFKKIVANKVS